jgi:hypothetical protein
MHKRSEQVKHTFLKIGVAALIFSIPLYPKFPFLSVPGTYVSIRLEDFVLIVVTLLWLWNVYPTIFSFFKNKAALAIILFLTISLLSVFSAVFLTKTVPLHIGFLHWARRVEYMLCFFVGMTSVKSKEDLLFYIKCLIIVIFWAFIYGVGQKYFSWPIITTQNLEYSKGIALRYMPGGHLVSTFAGHYDMATFLILVLPVILSTMFLNLKGFVEFNTKAKSMLFKGILAVTFLAGFWLLVNTASRISIVSYFISTILVLVLIRKLKYIPVLLAISILFVSLSTNLLARYSQIFNVYIQKIVLVQPLFAIDEESATTRRARTVEPTPAAIEVLEDRSTSIRLNIEWPRAIRAFQKNPFLGTGFSSITLATDNDYLRLLGEVGILGFLSFALILLRLVTFYVRKFLTFKGLTLRRGFILGIAAGLPGVLLNAVFIDVFEASKFAIMFWLLVGFSFSRVFGKNTNI